MSILQRSASYWAARGNPDWAKAVRGFRGGTVVMGALAILGATLELIDLYEDHSDATKSQSEKNLIVAKAATVFFMGTAASMPFLAGLIPAGILPAVSLGLSVTVFLVIAGALYLLLTILINDLKQDSVGFWLRRCCWSFSGENRYPKTRDGAAAERCDFLKIALSPSVLTRQTSHSELQPAGDSGYLPVAVQDGSWVQILLPGDLRGHSVEINIISSEWSWKDFSVKKSRTSIAKDFLKNGFFKEAASFGSVPTERPSGRSGGTYFPAIPSKNEDIVWQTWVPLGAEAEYIEVQVWYPQPFFAESPLDDGYVYQIGIGPESETTVDGLVINTSEIKTLHRSDAFRLELPA